MFSDESAVGDILSATDWSRRAKVLIPCNHKHHQSKVDGRRSREDVALAQSYGGSDIPLTSQCLEVG